MFEFIALLTIIVLVVIVIRQQIVIHELKKTQHIMKAQHSAELDAVRDEVEDEAVAYVVQYANKACLKGVTMAAKIITSNSDGLLAPAVVPQLRERLVALYTAVDTKGYFNLGVEEVPQLEAHNG